MFKFTGKVLSLSAATLMVSSVISSAASLDDLVKAAKAEGQLTTIALPHAGLALAERTSFRGGL